MAFGSSPVNAGDVLAEKYLVERVIGRGGMGVVMEARHLALDERVAMKLLFWEAVEDSDMRARFFREARAAAKIKSHHVARVSDVGTLESGAPYMVMEYLDGLDLFKVLVREGRLSVEDAVDYVVQACEALVEAHGLGIVHRDIKPANLFLSKLPSGLPFVKVLDFGISKMSVAGVEDITTTMAVIGSAPYMSPEQMQEARSVDHRADIYSLGVTLYELLTKRRPFEAKGLPKLCGEVLTGVPTSIQTHRADLPRELIAVVERAYARDRDQRWPSMADFALALAPFAPARSQTTVDAIARIAGRPAPKVVEARFAPEQVASSPSKELASEQHPEEVLIELSSSDLDPRPEMTSAPLTVSAHREGVVTHVMTPGAKKRWAVVITSMTFALGVMSLAALGGSMTQKADRAPAATSTLSDLDGGVPAQATLTTPTAAPPPSAPAKPVEARSSPAPSSPAPAKQKSPMTLTPNPFNATGEDPFARRQK